MLLHRELAVALVIVLFSVPTAIAQTEEGAVLKRPAISYETLTLALQAFTITDAAWPLEHNGARIAVGMRVDRLPPMLQEAMANGEARLFLVPTKDVEGSQEAPHAELIVETRDDAVVQMRFRALM